MTCILAEMLSIRDFGNEKQSWDYFGTIFDNPKKLFENLEVLNNEQQ